LAKTINAGQKATEVTTIGNQILPRNSLETSKLGRNFCILNPAGIPVALTGCHGPNWLWTFSKQIGKRAWKAKQWSTA